MGINIKIDGELYEVPEGIRLIDACQNVGIEIPHFCYHPALGPDGNCRMCQVEIITPRGAMLAISCNTIVNDGMEVVTNSERVQRVRAAVEEFLLLNHPLDCPICDKAGECTLQDYYMEYDRQDSRMKFPREKKGKAIVLGKTLVLDQERCVLCNRCVRFLRNIAGDEELFIAGRGHDSYITTFPGKEVTSPYSLNTVDLCPVGALTSRDFRFSSPTWYLARSPSVCTTCARGCSIEIHHRSGKVHRLRPRYNADVNGYWMCDEGRLNYQFINENRVKEFEFVGEGVKNGAPAEVTLHWILSALGLPEGGTAGGDQKTTSGKILLLASLDCTLEELFLLKKLAGAVEGVELFAVRHIPDGEGDEILKKTDRHSNAKSAELLGLRVIDLRDGAEEAGRSEIEAVLSKDAAILGVGFNVGVTQPLLDVISKAKTVVLVSSNKTPLDDKVSVVVPGLTFAEKEGLLINFEGHIQRLFPALAAGREGISEWKFIGSLLSSVGSPESFKNVSEIRETIRSEEAVFSGVDLNSIGLEGIRLTSLPVG